MASDDNIYKYITTEGKLFGEEAKRFTMLEYLQKSTGVFNQDGMLTKEQVKEMKARAQTGDKNLWHGFISFDEQHSKLIDHPEKCIALVKQMFGEFFKDIGFDKDNIDLMCALHLDKPHHLHIHYIFCTHAHVIIRRALEIAYRTDIIPINPAAKVQKPKSPKYEAKYYDIKQLKMLFECMQGDRFELMYKMTAFYGLRRSELCGMQWNSIDFGNNTLTLNHSVVQTCVDGKLQLIKKDIMKNASSKRTMPLIPDLKDALLKLRTKQENNRTLYSNGYDMKYVDYVWECAPKVKNKLAAGYTYRVKGKIPLSVIDKMTERLNAWAIPDDIAHKRDEATQVLFNRKDFCKAWDMDYATRELLSLAEKLPKDKPLCYASKDMELFRADIDFAVQTIIDTDEKVYKVDKAFRDELDKKRTALQDIMSKYYKARLAEEKETMNGEPPPYYEKYLGNIHTIEKLEWNYKRRMGNIVLKKVRYIQNNTYRYDKKRKRDCLYRQFCNRICKNDCAIF